MSIERKLKASFNLNTLLCFFCIFFIISNKKKKKKNHGQTLWGRIAPAISTKTQEAAIAIISDNTCAWPSYGGQFVVCE